MNACNIVASHDGCVCFCCEFLELGFFVVYMHSSTLNSMSFFLRCLQDYFLHKFIAIIKKYFTEKKYR